MTEKKNKDVPVPETDNRKYCGIIMPIASMGEYDATHWVRVKAVLENAIRKAGFEPRIVSDGEAIAVIHGNIVQNLYDDEIVVCDVSGKNPNVMFELGMRLAFDKPTVVVKDDATGYSFDTGPIKHIPYRRDQRFDDVEQFQAELVKSLTATMDAKNSDPKYSPFLRYFRNVTAKKLETEELSQADYILRKLDRLERILSGRQDHNYLSAAQQVSNKSERGWFFSHPEVLTKAERAALLSIAKMIEESPEVFALDDPSGKRLVVSNRLPGALKDFGPDRLDYLIDVATAYQKEAQLMKPLSFRPDSP